MFEKLVARLFKKYPPQVELVKEESTRDNLQIRLNVDKLLHEIKRLQTQVTSLQNSQTKMYRELKEKR